ncbi:MAG: TIGR03960 family B12-binding radical SAM protein [Coriobacteriia bacterium]
MSDENLWDRVEALLGSVARPARYLNSEWGAVRPKDADYRSVLVYPDTYEIGQPNQAVAILYDRLNAVPGVCAERAYVPAPDMSALMRERAIPLFSLESCAPVGGFDMIGITLPHELCFTNVLEVLDLAGVPLRAADRTADDPLVFGGGPCAYNPEPVAAFFDAILIGEGEGATEEMVAAHRAGKAAGSSRKEILHALADVPGVYVPSLYAEQKDERGRFLGLLPAQGAPARICKRVVSDLDHVFAPTHNIVPYMDVVHDRYAIEVLRGCSRGCRFCQAGMTYRPVRERRADTIVRDVVTGLKCSGYDEASLTSLSTTDHSQLEEVLRRLQRRLAGTGTSVSLPSLRVDAFGVEMAQLVSGGARKSGLTFAPEAGTQRMRDVINKNVTEEDLLGSVQRAFEAGWRRVKLYFMIGLPLETDDDVRGIGALVQKAYEAAREATPPAQRSSIKVAVSVSTFVPKAQTPFQWEPQITLAEVGRRQALLRETMSRKGVDLRWHDADESFLEAVMARGGRELAAVIERAWRMGAKFDAWTEFFSLSRWREAFSAEGVDPAAIANREFAEDEPLPWEHISAGVSRRYLLRERARSREAVTTPDCSFGSCTGCDVCGELGVEVVLGGDSRG